MHYEYQIILKRWLSILKENERTKKKTTPRPFRFEKALGRAHHISAKELRRYYVKGIQAGKKAESLLPSKRGAKPGSRRTPKEVERNIIKAYRRFGSNRYEL